MPTTASSMHGSRKLQAMGQVDGFRDKRTNGYCDSSFKASRVMAPGSTGIRLRHAYDIATNSVHTIGMAQGRLSDGKRQFAGTARASHFVV